MIVKIDECNAVVVEEDLNVPPEEACACVKSKRKKKKSYYLSKINIILREKQLRKSAVSNVLFYVHPILNS